jgi:hypothetical protein
VPEVGRSGAEAATATTQVVSPIIAMAPAKQAEESAREAPIARHGRDIASGDSKAHARSGTAEHDYDTSDGGGGVCDGRGAARRSCDITDERWHGWRHHYRRRG